MDKGYDYEEVRQLVIAWGYVGHIPPRDEREQIIHDIPNSQSEAMGRGTDTFLDEPISTVIDTLGEEA